MGLWGPPWVNGGGTQCQGPSNGSMVVGLELDTEVSPMVVGPTGQWEWDPTRPPGSLPGVVEPNPHQGPQLTERSGVEGHAGHGQAPQEAAEAVDDERGGGRGAGPRRSQLQVAPGEQGPATKPAGTRRWGNWEHWDGRVRDAGMPIWDTEIGEVGTGIMVLWDGDKGH